MEWITTAIKTLGLFDDRKEALNEAIKFIDKWSKENNIEYTILHNKDTGYNRILIVNRKYVYRFIVSCCTVETDKTEEDINFIGEKVLRPIYDVKYYSHLER